LAAPGPVLEEIERIVVEQAKARKKKEQLERVRKGRG